MATDYLEEPICPDCGTIHHDVSGILTRRPQTVFVCDECEATVEVQVHEMFSYSTAVRE